MTDPDPAPPPEPAFVLVVDDNADAAESLTRFLRASAGHVVRVAHDGATGIRLASTDKPDVVVCDLATPGLDGLKLAEAVGRHDPRPLLIAVTGLGGLFPEAQARAAGFDHSLAKPADPNAVAALIAGRRRPSEP